MRLLRYSLLAAALLATLVVLAVSGAAQFRSVAREQASSLAAGLSADLRAFREHAMHLVREEEGAILRHLVSFRGLARVKVFDAAGAETMQAERYGDIVALMPRDRLTERLDRLVPVGEVEVSGFEVDETRRDVHPSLRNVLHYATGRESGGVLVLTVYAEPFLAALREAGANLIGTDGLPRLGPLPEGPSVLGRGEGWAIWVPVTYAAGRLAAWLGIGLSVLVLGAALVVLSERQLRAQERVALERRLAQSDRLSALGMLAAGVAHEINNPLEGISNWLQLNKVDKAKEGLERIRKIARDMLAFARPKAEEGVADVRESVDRALELARYAKDFAGVEVESRVAPALLARIAPGALDQVFLNLLLNAAAAMRQSPRRRVEIDAMREGGRIRVTFRDTGPGIAPDDLRRIFEPFYSRTGGTGLGLPVSYGIARTAGGDLRAENSPGGGACLTVEVVPA